MQGSGRSCPLPVWRVIRGADAESRLDEMYGLRSADFSRKPAVNRNLPARSFDPVLSLGHPGRYCTKYSGRRQRHARSAHRPGFRAEHGFSTSARSDRLRRRQFLSRRETAQFAGFASHNSTDSALPFTGEKTKNQPHANIGRETAANHISSQLDLFTDIAGRQ